VAGASTHDTLSDSFPGATRVECDGHGMVTVYQETRPAAGTRCPVCAATRIAEAVRAFTPPRFRRPIDIPPKAQAWAAAGTSAQGLYLAGQVGTGKTHTAWTAVGLWCAAAQVLPCGEGPTTSGARRPPTVIFTRLTDLLDDLRPGDDSRRCIRDCQAVPLLVLDDIGAEKPSEWTQERLYSIIDHRYANCLPLIVTSNLPPSRSSLAPQTGVRTQSRLAEMCGEAVMMTGADRRIPA